MKKKHLDKVADTFFNDTIFKKRISKENDTFFESKTKKVSKKKLKKIKQFILDNRLKKSFIKKCFQFKNENFVWFKIKKKALLNYFTLEQIDNITYPRYFFIYDFSFSEIDGTKTPFYINAEHFSSDKEIAVKIEDITYLNKKDLENFEYQYDDSDSFNSKRFLVKKDSALLKKIQKYLSNNFYLIGKDRYDYLNESMFQNINIERSFLEKNNEKELLIRSESQFNLVGHTHNLKIPLYCFGYGIQIGRINYNDLYFKRC